MNLLLSSFGGAFLGVLITNFVNWYLSKKNYKRDYHKKIIDKRINACEVISSFLMLFKKIESQRETNKTYIFYSEIQDINKIKKIIEKANSTINYLPWTTNKLSNSFIALSNLLIDLQEDLETSSPDKHFIILDVYSKKIEIKLKDIFNNLYTELKTLDDIDDFFNDIKTM